MTKTQRTVLMFIEAEIARTGGVAPSFREIAAHFGVSRSVVHRQVMRLAEQGHIRHSPHMVRSIQVLRPTSRVRFYRFDDEAKILVSV